MSYEPYLLLPLRARDGTVRAHAIIDEADRRLAAQRWSLNDNGYVVRTVRTTGGWRVLRLHREVLGLSPGDGLEGDHWDGNRLDCRRSNLRIRTRAQNAQNLPAMGGTSEHRGVTWSAARGKWQASAQVAGEQVNLGRFDDEQAAADAASAYRTAHMPFTNEARRMD